MPDAPTDSISPKKWQTVLTALCMFGLGTGLLLYAVVFAVTAGKGEYFFSRTTGEPNSDYLFWYVAGLVTLSPERSHIYDSNVLLRFWNEVISPAHVTVGPPFVYPPYFALFFSPFAALPLPVSYTFWIVLTVIAGILAIRLILRSRQVFSRKQTFAFFMVALAIPASLVCVRIGQLSWFYLALGALFYYCFHSKRDLLAGVCLSLLSTKPHYFMFFAVPAVMDRRWKTLASLVVAELVLLVASCIVFGFETVISYPSVLMNKETTAAATAPHRMISLRLIYTALLPPALALKASMITMLAAVLVVAAVWFFTVKRNLSRQWSMAITVLCLLIASAHTHVYDALLLILPAAITLNTTSLFTAMRIKSWHERVWNCLLIAYALCASFVFFFAPGLFLQDLSPYILGIHLILFGIATAGLLADWRGLSGSQRMETTA